MIDDFKKLVNDGFRVETKSIINISIALTVVGFLIVLFWYLAKRNL